MTLLSERHFFTYEDLLHRNASNADSNSIRVEEMFAAILQTICYMTATYLLLAIIMYLVYVLENRRQRRNLAWSELEDLQNHVELGENEINNNEYSF